MKTFGLLVLVLGLALVAPFALAQSTTFKLTANDNLAWVDASGTKNPTLNAAPGQTITIDLESKSGFHNLNIKAPVNAKSEDVDSTGTATTTFTFTAPASGSAQWVCDYHATDMKGTINFGAASTSTPATENKSPGVALLGVSIALIGAALLVRRK